MESGHCDRLGPATTVTDHSAWSLKSNDLAHFTDFCPRRSHNVRPTDGVNALISTSCRKSGRWWMRRRRRRVVLSHPAPEDSFDEEDSGALVRCANRLVRNHRTARGGATMTRRRLESGLRDYEDDSIFDGVINHYRVPYSESISRLSIRK